MKTDFSDLFEDKSTVIDFGDSADNMPTLEHIPIVELEDISAAAKPEKKKTKKRKRCDICDSMIAIENFDNPELHACVKPEVPAEPLYSKEVAAANLYNLQFTAYFMIEKSLNSYGRSDMDGLADKMESMREQYLSVFEQIYEQNGPEWIDQYLSPTLLWGMLTAENLGTTFFSNKKNRE